MIVSYICLVVLATWALFLRLSRRRLANKVNRFDGPPPRMFFGNSLMFPTSATGKRISLRCTLSNMRDGAFAGDIFSKKRRYQFLPQGRRDRRYYWLKIGTLTEKLISIQSCTSLIQNSGTRLKTSN